MLHVSVMANARFDQVTPVCEVVSLPRQLFDPYAVWGCPPTATPDEISVLPQPLRALLPTPEPHRSRSARVITTRVLASYALRGPRAPALYDRAAHTL